MRIFSSFKVGITLVVIASIWIWVLFSSGEKASLSTELNVKETATIDLYLEKNGLGFYTITIPEYVKHVLFVQILDPHGNVIADKKISTKMSVNYFRFSDTGKYTMEITNFSEEPVSIKVNLGDAIVYQLTIPAIIAFIGAAIIVYSGYRKLSNQSTAQPEENIS
ncbi:MAG: hypothetical protein HZA82_02005 [Thaumarchaeota archaeon]|nr:hypothetical protein [Nitrososphaerota archaeon]